VRVISLIPEFTGTLPSDLLLVSSTPRPQVVPVDAAVAGSAALFARTEPIDLSKISQSQTATVKVSYPFKVPAHTTLPQTCEVDILVEPFDQLAAKRIKVELRGVSPKQECVVSPPELVLRSPEVAELSPQQHAEIRAVVDVTGLRPGEYRLTPQLFLPPELDRVKLDPSTVLVTIIPQGG
jgi:YbbR domain-containing protein